MTPRGNILTRLDSGWWWLVSSREVSMRDLKKNKKGAGEDEQEQKERTVQCELSGEDQRTIKSQVKWSEVEKKKKRREKEKKKKRRNKKS